MTTMTVDELMCEIETLSKDDRNAIRARLNLDEDHKPQLSDWEDEQLSISLAQAARGEFVSHDELLADIGARRSQ